SRPSIIVVVAPREGSWTHSSSVHDRSDRRRLPLPAGRGLGRGGSPQPGSVLQRLGMMPQVIADEARDEVIAVVVAFLHAQRQWMAVGITGLLQVIGLELLFQEVVTRALVHQQRQALFRAGNQ